MSTTSTTVETANNAPNNTPNKNGVPKQVKFAANPVMISHAPPNAAIVLPTTKTEGQIIDSQPRMKSTTTPTNVITTPSQSNVPPSPNKGSPSTVKGTIPVTDLVDPNIVKNVIVSVPPAGSDHTYAKTSPKKKSTNEISSSDDTSSSSGEDMETEETKEKGSVPVSTTPTTPTTKSTKPKQTASTGKQRGRPRKNANTSTPSVTTPTPRSILKSTPEIKVDYERVRRRGRGCGNCAGCLRDDCGKCCYCLDKPKFGGPGRKKQRCALRICAHFVSLKSSPGVRNSIHNKAAAILSVVSSPEIASVTSTPTSTSAKKSDPVVTTTKTTEQTKPSVTTTPTLPSISSTTTTVITSSPSSTPQTQGTPRTKQGGGTSGALSGDHIKCVMCGRERKVNMSRSNKFCGARCLKTWEEFNPGKNPETAEPRTLSLPMILQASMEKPVPRALRNLQIDMALPGGFHQTPLSSVASLSSAGDLLTIGPLISSITSAVSNMTVPTVPTMPTITNGIKRSSQEQPAIPSKKSKPAVSSSSVLVSSTPVVTTPTISPSPVPKGKKKLRSDLPSDVSKWSILEVMQYFEGTPDCTHIAPVLQEQEVDGEALFLLSHDSLVKCLGMKLGPALKVMTHVERLKSQTSSLV